MNILWLGPLVSDYALRMKKAPNQAEAKWSRGLLGALNKIGCNIDVVSHVPEQCWPRGNIIWQSANDKWFEKEFNILKIAYPNLPIVREMFLDMAYGNAVRKICSEKRIDAVMCYNSMHSFHVAGMEAARKLGVKTIPVVLDAGQGKSSPLDDNWATMLKNNRGASGIVFLSYYCIKKYPNRSVPLLHMDGGAVGFADVPPRRIDCMNPINIVYTGALDKTRGSQFLAEVIALLRDLNVRFIVCGKNSEAFRACLPDGINNVEIKGFVSQDELDRISSCADMFVSMREPNYALNLFNYPSKIPNYLAWGRPVISTWLESFSPEYRDILCIPSECTPQSFADKIREVISWTEQERQTFFEKIKKWFATHKDWTIQANRIVNFIQGLDS